MNAKSDEDNQQGTMNERLTLDNCLSEHIVRLFQDRLERCARITGRSRPDLPRMPKETSGSKRLAYTLAMHEAMDRLDGPDLAQLLLHYVTDEENLVSPETCVIGACAERVGGSEAFEPSSESD